MYYFLSEMFEIGFTIIFTGVLLLLIYKSNKAKPIKIKKVIQVPTAKEEPKNTPIPSPKEPTINEKRYNLLKEKWVERKVNEIINFSNVPDLLKNTPINDIRYPDLLNCFEWQFKRFKILVRDNFTCQDCQVKGDRLHVHHKYYLSNVLPWEIDDSVLVSLCKNCHSERHKKEIINIYDKVGNQLHLSNHVQYICWKCNGTGYLPQYAHYQNGVCFACLGNVINTTIFSNRLNQISADFNLYEIGNIENEFLDFCNSITVDYFINNIQNKLYSEEESEINDFFSLENQIIYTPGKSELLDFLLNDNDILNNKNTQKQSKESHEDDLPF
jgi:hypothetical protein